MYKNIFIGLDPGSSSGAYGIIDQDGNYVACGEIPTVNSRVDALALLRCISMPFESYFAVENVHTMTGQGISSSGKFMRAAGAIEATAALTGSPMVLVSPQMWKRHHGLIGTEKKASLELARKLWPDAPLKLVKHHGRSDALLMALWLKDQVE
jgi:Holliday junction resolvasome RuvABC endonuclease subunit